VADNPRMRDGEGNYFRPLTDEITSRNGQPPLQDGIQAQIVKLATGGDGVANDFDLTSLATDARLAAIQTLLSTEGGYLDGVETLLGRLPAGGAAADATLQLLTALIANGALTVAPSKPGDQASGLTDGRQTVTTPGTAVAVRGSLACKWVCVTALKTNTGQVNVGGAGVLATSGGSTGQPLAAGESFTVPVTNANLVFVDARVAGEGVSFTVGA
jgi:hypothetical protein